MTETPKSLAQRYPKSYTIPVLIVSATCLLVLGMTLPVLTLTELIFWTNTFSILTGIASLFDEGHILLAVVIIFFSVIFPLLKLGTLFLIWFAKWPEKRREWAIHLLANLGKWSMLDVFVVALVVMTAKSSVIADARVGIGAWCFAAAAITSTIAIAALSKRHREE